ncbi:hypothetical protein PSPO01_06369 [Paraphaeosphaeria sporulosa]
MRHQQDRQQRIIGSFRVHVHVVHGFQGVLCIFGRRRRQARGKFREK